MGMTPTTGADMTDDEIKSLAKQHYAMYDHWQIDLVAFARALLARQPAAIDKQDERVAFEAAWSKVYDTGDFLLRHYSITEQYVNHDTQRAWEGWKLRAASTSANVAQGAEAVASLRRIAHELRAYNPAADEYKGEHIHKVWAREIEALLSDASNGESK
jgi:hypothetical protein